jgi:CHAT domain-containing protein/tetratricopeptide (TPR) repeat protein
MGIVRACRTVALVTLSAFFLITVVSCQYLYLHRRPLGRPAVGDLLRDPDASRNPEILLLEADRFYWLSNDAKAAPLYRRAEELFAQKGDSRSETYARIGRIRSQSQAGPLPEVSAVLDRELENPAVRGDAKLKLWCLAAKGYTDLDVNLSSSKQAWNEAQQIAKTLGDKRWQTRAEAELGTIAFLEGDIRRAGAMVGDAFFSEVISGDVGGEIRELEMLGNAFNEVRRYEEAQHFFDHAIRLSNDTPGAGFPYLAYEGKAQSLAFEGKIGEARGALDPALGVARKEEKMGEATQILIQLGELAMQTGHREQAIQYLQEAGELGGKFGWYRNLAQAMFDLVKLHRDSGDLAQAERCAAAGLDASRRVGDRYYLPRDLTVLADLKALHGDAKKAEALYQQAEDVIDKMLVNMNQPYWSSSLAGAMSETYLHHFGLALRSGDVAKAFGVLERVRGRTAAVVLENKVPMSKSESSEAQSMEAKVAGLQVRLLHSDDAGERTTLREQLFESERHLEWARIDQGVNAREWLEKPASVPEIQSVLRADEIILEYVLDEPLALCLWISRNGIGVKWLPTGKQRIETLTRKYVDTIRGRQDDVAQSMELQQILLGPVAEQIAGKRLIVVPDGILHFLPFDALHDSERTVVAESWTVNYVPAATILKVLRSEDDARQTPRAFLGVGDAAYQNQGKISRKVGKPQDFRGRLRRGFSDVFGTPLYDLPRTREEVLEVSKIAGSDAVVLLGADATETKFKAQPLAEFQVVHLAVHGFADTEFPERSALVLGLDPSSEDDGLLQVREILRLHFHADLVTLSACDTGIGRLQGEEGITNLPEGFLVSGAKAVVVSLWSADDTYTLALMTRFYTHIAEGRDKAAALQLAKLDILAEYGAQTPPYYWDAFVLVGDGGSPVSLNRP